MEGRWNKEVKPEGDFPGPGLVQVGTGRESSEGKVRVGKGRKGGAGK